jgi:hypothetical protein
VCIGLPLACATLDDDAAQAMVERIDDVGGAVSLLDDPALRDQWLAALRTTGDRAGVHGLVAGRTWRLLLDAGAADRDAVAAELSKALSRAADAAAGAAWIEGFLAGGGLVLVHDEALLGLIDAWLVGLPDDGFRDALPLVRRSFSSLGTGERRQLATRLKEGAARRRDGAAPADDVDRERGVAALPLVAAILGVPEAVDG